VIELQVVVWFGAMCALIGALGITYLAGMTHGLNVRVSGAIQVTFSGSHAVAVESVVHTNGISIPYPSRRER